MCRKARPISGLWQIWASNQLSKRWEVGGETSHRRIPRYSGKFPIGGLTRRPGQMAGSKLESQFLFLWRVAQGPALEREVKFHPTRKWRADFGHLESRTLIEIEGGIFMRAGGRHTRGGGYANDAEKYLEAALAGWRVLRLTERQLEIGFIERIVALLNTPQAEAPSLESDPIQ